MSEFDQELARDLEDIRAQQLYRHCARIDSPQGPRVAIEGRTYLNFSSNDYLGLANHPSIKAAARAAVEKFGAGSGASRLICGSLAPHEELERELAAFKGTPAALSFSSGYATALGTIGALVGKDDVIVLDRLVHASIVDAARLSGAKLRVFAHNDLDELEHVLRWAVARGSEGDPSRLARRQRVLIVTESVFSMDGDFAPLPAMVELKHQYGAWLMVDEAHATGLFGPGGRGLLAQHSLTNRVEVQMGTLGKALGAAGGYICGSPNLIDLLINRARSFIFSTAPVPAAAAAAQAGIRLALSEEGETRRRTLRQRIAQLRAALASGGCEICPTGEAASGQPASAIVPHLVGLEAAALRLAISLREHGVYVPAIRYPTVGRGKARLRFTITAAHTAEDIQTLETILRNL